MENSILIRPEVVLIAEDDPASLLALAGRLELEGYTTLQALTGEAALAHYDDCNGQIDFVITGFHLPDCNGMELIAELRWQGSTVPMLIVTAATLDEVMLVQHGASAVMAKPLDINALVAWLKKQRDGASV